jgi:hypothetical protein
MSASFREVEPLAETTIKSRFRREFLFYFFPTVMSPTRNDRLI